MDRSHNDTLHTFQNRIKVQSNEPDVEPLIPTIDGITLPTAREPKIQCPTKRWQTKPFRRCEASETTSKATKIETQAAKKTTLEETPKAKTKKIESQKAKAKASKVGKSLLESGQKCEICKKQTKTNSKAGNKNSKCKTEEEKSLNPWKR